MKWFNKHLRKLILNTHYKNGECASVFVLKLRTTFECGEAPTASTVLRLVWKF